MIRVLTGPTGSGKTALALQLAGSSMGMVINTDPCQFYKEFPILSDQPTVGARRIRFLRDRSILEPITSGEFSRIAERYLKEEALWCGTGLYLGAALYGLDKDRRKGTPFQGRPRDRFKMIVLNPPREWLYERINKRVESMIERGALREAKQIFDWIKTGRISSKAAKNR